jgi:peptidoglycan/LPS O-acetylase OafA/YrhL
MMKRNTEKMSAPTVPAMQPYDHPRLKNNNFDLLRILFAGTVCFVHSYDLSHYPDLSWIPRILSSEAAVKSFFVVSGLLIFMSYERSSSLSSYWSKRIRRIYPAYFTVVMLAALGLAFASSKSPAEYFSAEWLKYVAANLVFLNFLQPNLPGVFEANRITAVNGALWTLKIEVLFYLSVPVLAFLFRRFSRFWTLVMGYLLSIGYAQFLSALAIQSGNDLFAELGRQLPGQLAYFLAGAFFYYYLPVFEKYNAGFISAASAILVADRFYSLPWLEPFALATMVAFFGLFFHLGNLGKYGDFSYGVYILHFPIIQLFVQYRWLDHNAWLYFFGVVLATLTLAAAMWHLVEKRFLLRNSHYIARADTAGRTLNSRGIRPAKQAPPDAGKRR